MSDDRRETRSPWETARGVVTDALRDLPRSWRSLALTDVSCKLLAFAVLTPAT